MRTIVIVGGGYCGTALATMLLRRPPATPTRLVLIERGVHVGRGVAFAARDFPYLLNVPAGRMSANPADPLEFLRFMQRREPGTDAESFLPRAWYGDYLEESLQAASLAAPRHIRIDVIRASVTSIHRNRRDLPLRVRLDDRTELYGDEVVLAVGNPPPRRLGVAEALAGHPGYVEDPWTLSAMTGHGERLFLIGTGLTMVDAVLAAAARGEGSHVEALSRHGLIASRQAAFRPKTFRSRALSPARAALLGRSSASLARGGARTADTSAADGSAAGARRPDRLAAVRARRHPRPLASARRVGPPAHRR